MGSEHWGQRPTLIGPLDDECHGDELWPVKTHPSSQADDGGLGKGVSGWLQVLSFRWLSPLGHGTESCQYFGGRDKMITENGISTIYFLILDLYLIFHHKNVTFENV